ncbi:MAG: hypothetical protein NZ703_11775 [Gemmataceae bacterium]|nr:hypothetical protein [Gemmataceae bacterium]
MVPVRFGGLVAEAGRAGLRRGRHDPLELPWQEQAGGGLCEAALVD